MLEQNSNNQTDEEKLLSSLNHSDNAKSNNVTQVEVTTKEVSSVDDDVVAKKRDFVLGENKNSNGNSKASDNNESTKSDFVFGSGNDNNSNSSSNSSVPPVPVDFGESLPPTLSTLMNKQFCLYRLHR